MKLATPCITCHHHVESYLPGLTGHECHAPNGRLDEITGGPAHDVVACIIARVNYRRELPSTDHAYHSQECPKWEDATPRNAISAWLARRI